LPPGGYDDSLEEAIDRIENPSPGQRPLALLIEWAENMPEILIPESRLEIYWQVQQPENAGRKDIPDDVAEKVFKETEAEQTAREVVLKGVGAAAKLPVFADNYFIV
ncbi:MAG: hypothetical protein IJD04_06965, partial [Desulfovibrionaceae bacterium]|nr:hypothetical protein [Desulfovibrionaceae bacterium]